MIEQTELASLTLFQDALPEVVKTLAECAVELRFATDAVVFTKGDVPRGWFVVLEGQVRVVRLSGNRQHVVHTESRGGTLGEVPLFADGTHPVTAITAEPTRLALWSREALERAMRECPSVAHLLLRRLALRVRGLVERLDDRSLLSVNERLAEFLRERQALRPTSSFTLGMTQQQLAEELGTAREVISRELLRLRKAGQLETLGGGRYRMLPADKETSGNSASKFGGVRD